MLSVVITKVYVMCVICCHSNNNHSTTRHFKLALLVYKALDDSTAA